MAKWHQVAEVAIVLCVIALAILIFGISGVPYCLYHCLSYYVKGHCLPNQQNVCSKNQKFAPSNAAGLHLNIAHKNVIHLLNVVGIRFLC